MVKCVITTCVLFISLLISLPAAAADVDEALLKEGETFFNQSKYEKAIEVFDKLAASFPDSRYAPYAVYGSAIAYLKLKDYNQARVYFNRLINDYGYLEDLRSDALFGLAECYRAQKNYNQALSIYDKIIERYPGRKRQAQLARGWVLYKKGDTDQATRYLSSLLEDSSQIEALKMIYMMGTMLKQQKRFTSAVDTFKRIPKDSVMANDVYYQIGDIAIQVKNYARAVDFLQYVKNQPSYIDENVNLLEPARYRLALAYYNLEKIYEARIVCEDFIRRFPQSQLIPEINDILILTYLRQDKIDELMVYYQSLPDKAIKGEDQAIETTIADYFYSQGSFKQALNFYRLSFDETARKYPPKDLFNIGNSYFYLEEYEQAADTYKEFLRAYPKSEYAPQAAFRLAYTFSRRQNYESALKLYTTIEKYFPEVSFADSVVYNIGWCLTQSGEEGKAIAYYDKFLDNYPQSQFRPKVLYEAGQLHFYGARYNEAVTYYQEAIDDYPDSEIAADALYRLAESYAALGQYELADKKWQELISEHKGSRLAKGASFQRIQSYYHNKEINKFFDEAPVFIDNYPEDKLSFEVLHLIRKAAVQENDIEGGLEILEDIRSRHTADALLTGEITTALAGLYLESGDSQAASEEIKEILSGLDYSDKNLPADDSIKVIGRVLAATDKEQALNFYQQVSLASDNNDTKSLALAQRGRLLNSLGDYQEAKRLFNDIINNYPDSAYIYEARLGLANTYYLQADYAKAAGIYEELIKKYRQENTIEAYFQLAETYYQQQRFADALLGYQHIIVFYPDESGWSTKALLKAGICQEQLKQFEKAKTLYARLIEGYPRTQEAEIAREKMAAIR